MAEAESILTSVLKRDRLLILGALSLITILAWTYIWTSAHAMTTGGGMAGMQGMAMTSVVAMGQWNGAYAFSQFLMWVIMMIGMMTPSVAPMVLVYARVAEKAGPDAHFAEPYWFMLGYLLAWSIFAVAATGAEWALERTMLITPALASADRVFGATLLIVAGIWQWLPTKDACLAACRAPLSFIQQQGGFRPGIAATLRIGILHGAYCVGCCWALMALLFVAGAMNLTWIAALMVLVLLEKIAPHGNWIARGSGVLAIAAGILMLA